MPDYPPLPTTVGKSAHLSFPDGSTMDWDVVEEIRKAEDAEKILLLQRLRSKTNPEQFMLRFGYYIIGKKPRVQGRWVWGQFAPFIGEADFAEIIAEAKSKKWI